MARLLAELSDAELCSIKASPTGNALLWLSMELGSSALLEEKSQISASLGLADSAIVVHLLNASPESLAKLELSEYKRLKQINSTDINFNFNSLNNGTKLCAEDMLCKLNMLFALFTKQEQEDFLSLFGYFFVETLADMLSSAKTYDSILRLALKMLTRYRGLGDAMFDYDYARLEISPSLATRRELDASQKLLQLQPACRYCLYRLGCWLTQSEGWRHELSLLLESSEEVVLDAVLFAKQIPAYRNSNTWLDLLLLSRISNV